MPKLVNCKWFYLSVDLAVAHTLGHLRPLSSILNILGVKSIAYTNYKLVSAALSKKNVLFLYASRLTHKAWRPLQLFYSRGLCHPLLRLKQGYPFYSPYGCRLGYHLSEAWPVEQNALPPQFYVASLTSGFEPTLCGSNTSAWIQCS